ncbi:MAG: radical SAM protein [Nanoarchaeota archaeon]|nr:radical SAM protein [Nanoarchaeota archaeon]
MDIKLISPSGIMYRNGGIFPRALRYAPSTLTTLAALVPSELEAKITLADEGVDDVKLNDSPDLVGITAITGTANRTYAIADSYRSKGVPVVIGGVHPTLMPQEAMEHADSVVTGLGFESWPQLLRDFDKGEMQRIYTQRPNIDLTNLPSPRLDLLKPWSYITKTSIQATFGCPYRCDFCAVVAKQNQYIHRPVKDVIKELEGMDSKFVVFVDPSPTEDKKYIKELWTAMIPLKKRWGGLATVRIAQDDELVSLAAKSGCTGLLLGFESVSQDGVNVINKDFNRVGSYREVVKKLHDNGIAINGTFMFGMDTDDKDSFKRTVDFVQENNIDLPRYAIITPFPGTALFDRLDREGRILTKNWALYDAQHVVFQPKNLSPDEVREGQLWAWEQTYKSKSIMKRVIGSRCSPFISLFTNFAYKYYGDRLRNYSDEVMLEIEEKWNPKPQFAGLEKKIG